MTREGEDPVAPSPWTRFEPPLTIDPGDLDRLVERFLPGARVVRAAFIPRGVVNSNYCVELMPVSSAVPARVLLRLSRSGEGALREGAIGAMPGGLPGCLIPRLLGSEMVERPEPHRRSLFNWIDGRPLDAVAPDGDPPGGSLPAAAEALGRALAALHGRALPAFGRLTPDLAVAAPAAAGWWEDLTRRAGSRLDNPAHGLERRRLDGTRGGFARLVERASAGPPIMPALVHGDLSPGNIILDDAGGSDVAAGAPGPGLRGLVDWEMARAADPAHDLASLRFELGGRWPVFARLVELSYLEAARDRRRAEGGISGPGFPGDWDLRVALASIPILLDARMVAQRRRDRGALDRVDALLAAALTGGAG